MLSSIDTIQSNSEPKDICINQIFDDRTPDMEDARSIDQVAESLINIGTQSNVASVIDPNFTQTQEQYPPATHCSPKHDELHTEFQAKPRRDTNPYVNPNVPGSHEELPWLT